MWRIPRTSSIYVYVCVCWVIPLFWSYCSCDQLNNLRSFWIRSDRELGADLRVQDPTGTAFGSRPGPGAVRAFNGNGRMLCSRRAARATGLGRVVVLEVRAQICIARDEEEQEVDSNTMNI